MNRSHNIRSLFESDCRSSVRQRNSNAAEAFLCMFYIRGFYVPASILAGSMSNSTSCGSKRGAADSSEPIATDDTFEYCFDRWRGADSSDGATLLVGGTSPGCNEGTASRPRQCVVRAERFMTSCPTIRRLIMILVLEDRAFFVRKTQPQGLLALGRTTTARHVVGPQSPGEHENGLRESVEPMKFRISSSEARREKAAFAGTAHAIRGGDDLRTSMRNRIDPAAHPHVLRLCVWERT
jgi:hypothetical protein